MNETCEEPTLKPIFDDEIRDAASTQKLRMDVSTFVQSLPGDQRPFPVDPDSVWRLLLREYFLGVGSLAIDYAVIAHTANAFLQELTATARPYLILLSISRLAIDAPFEPADDVRFRQASHEDLVRLARVYPGASTLERLDEHQWLCEIRRTVAVGSPDDVRAAEALIDRVIGTLALSLPGVATFKLERAGFDTRYSGQAWKSSGSPIWAHRHGAAMTICAADVAPLRDIYVALGKVASGKSLSSLALAYRRLRAVKLRQRPARWTQPALWFTSLLHVERYRGTLTGRRFTTPSPTRPVHEARELLTYREQELPNCGGQTPFMRVGRVSAASQA